RDSGRPGPRARDHSRDHGDNSPLAVRPARPSLRPGRRARTPTADEGATMTTDGSNTAERRPRLGSLPGSSALVRISDGAWGWLRAVMLEQEPPAQINEEQT